MVQHGYRNRGRESLMFKDSYRIWCYLGGAEDRDMLSVKKCDSCSQIERKEPGEGSHQCLGSSEAELAHFRDIIRKNAGISCLFTCTLYLRY